MKSLLAVTMSLGLLAAASGSAMAGCASHDNVTAEAPMTPIVTADSADTATGTVVKEADKKG